VLKCEVEPLRPVLDFSFRFHAGYTAWVPLSQFRGAGHKWTVVVRIEPGLGGQPVYFEDTLNLPDVPDTKLEGQAGGGYLLGEGFYRASLLLVDDQNRGCRSEWNIEAALGGEDRHVKMAIEPGTVQEVSWRGARSVSARGDAPLGRLTVLLHAAPVSPHLSQMDASDAVTLLGALSSLMDLAPAESVRLVVFNLDQQKEIYRHEHFTLDQLEAVRQAIFDLQLAVVDYKTLQNPNGHLDLLNSLVSRELRAESRSDAVVFLGPHARSEDKPAAPPETRDGRGPKFFYVDYQVATMALPPFGGGRGRGGRGRNASGMPDASQPMSTRGGIVPNLSGGGGNGAAGVDPLAQAGSVPMLEPRDTIDFLVATLKGKTLVVRTPGDFAKAMRLIAAQKK